MVMATLITKANGEQEPFKREKLERSLTRVGASQEMQEHIIAKVEEKLHDGISTQEIYEYAFEILRADAQKPVAARYSVKRAVLDLGPSGFPFEYFVAEVLRAIGYTDVQTGVAMQGKCAPHEVDIAGMHEQQRMIGEIKFHNNLGVKTDLKVALYVKARFDDLQAAHKNIDEGWLITNTRFTRNAARYGNCSNMRLLGWDYPRERGLEVLIDEAGVHPVTALTTLTNQHKRALLDDGLVLCRQLDTGDDVLRAHGVPQEKHAAIREEVTRLCGLSPKE